jgi:protein TonB
MFRWLLGLPLAAAVTVVLFLFAAALIAQGPVIVDPIDPPVIKIVAKPPPPGEPKPKPPRITGEPPPVDLPTPPPGKKPGPKDIGVGPIGPTTITPPLPGGAARPIVKIPPQYPETCRARGVEGTVIVEFDVTDRGEVVNPRVVHSDNSCFNRTVVQTVSRWKYPAEARRGVKEQFVFTLTEQ